MIRQTTLCIWALWVALSAVHLAATTVLLGAIDLLGLTVLTGWLTGAGRLIADRRELWTTHLRRHHMLLAVLCRLALTLIAILTLTLGVLAVALFILLALSLFFLLLGLPFLADLLEFCVAETC